MSDVEQFFMSFLVIIFAAIFYCAGKGDFLKAFPKIIEDRLKEATRKSGEWIIFKTSADVTFMCSECEATFTEADREKKCYFNYCPNCGADMRTRSD